MGHIKLNETRAQITPSEWLKVGANVTTLVNDFARRSDLVAYVGPNAGGSAPACFIPETAEIEVNVGIAFGRATTPEQIKDLTQRKNQFEFPKAVGAILHEAFHARFSRWDIKKAIEELTDKDEFDALMLLEESRIEGRGLSTDSSFRPFLRSCAMEIVVDEAEEKFKNSSSVSSAAFLVGLVLARVEAGILLEEEVEDISKLINDFLGEELVSKLVELAQKFQTHTIDTNMELTYPIVKEWVKLIREKKEEKGENNEENKQQQQMFVEALKDALQETKEQVETSSTSEVLEMEQDEEWKEIVKARKDRSKLEEEHTEIAKEVYSDGTSATDNSTSSVVIDVRKPNPDERVAAVKIAQILERAKYRERDEFEINSVTPPGRLRTRSLVQASAMKERGVNTPTEAWRRTIRKHTDDPTLSVGIMVDISGSMNPAMGPMASTAWIMSEAVRRVQGKVSMVYFGNSVFPTLRVGQKLDNVTTYSAVDNTEQFDRGFKALNGNLNLLGGRGARLLVVVSDANYKRGEAEKALRWIQECAKSGVGVLFIPIHQDYYAQRLCNNTGAVVLSDTVNPAEVATEIGKAAGKALQKASVAP
jgi:hypothetical protein